MTKNSALIKPFLIPLLSGLLVWTTFLINNLTADAATLSAATASPTTNQPTETPQPSVTPTATLEVAILLPGEPTGQPGTPQPPSMYMPFISKDKTHTPTPTFTPTATATKEITPTTVLYCNKKVKDIPDNDPSGVSTSILIGADQFVVDLNLQVDVNHTWVGDLSASLSHEDANKQITLVDRPGYPTQNNGCNRAGIQAILDDEITLPVKERCSTDYPAISGIYRPEEPLEVFEGELFKGTWTLNVADHYQADTGWANHFGVRIGEFEFFNKLPVSDNPDKGFVGDVYGTWGQIPPAPYGVHAEPVAKLLREYGLNAYAHRPLSWEGLKAEVAAGRPVFVWVVGNAVHGIPTYYLDSSGALTVVARYEHTVIVTGYSSNSVTYLNGSTLYTVDRAEFLESWSALRNMAITARP
ncbi:MAG: C39 family peptidase [Anaerolineales bacterium]